MSSLREVLLRRLSTFPPPCHIPGRKRPIIVVAFVYYSTHIFYFSEYSCFYPLLNLLCVVKRACFCWFLGTTRFRSSSCVVMYAHLPISVSRICLQNKHRYIICSGRKTMMVHCIKQTRRCLGTCIRDGMNWFQLIHCDYNFFVGSFRMMRICPE